MESYTCTEIFRCECGTSCSWKERGWLSDASWINKKNTRILNTRLVFFAFSQWQIARLTSWNYLLSVFPQVNGLAKVEHDEAVVEAIRRDPIVVQVLRRTPTRAAAAVVHNSTSSPQDVCVVDVCTQTDITFEHIMALAKLRPATPPVPDICPFLLSDRWEQALR